MTRRRNKKMIKKRFFDIDPELRKVYIRKDGFELHYRY